MTARVVYPRPPIEVVGAHELNAIDSTCSACIAVTPPQRPSTVPAEHVVIALSCIMFILCLMGMVLQRPNTFET